MRISALLALPSLGLAALLIGCGVDSISVAHSTAGALNINGVVHGGQQPVKNAQILLYTVGKTGNGSAATSMITGPAVYTDSNGDFSLSSGSGSGATYDYTCGNSTDQIYIVAVGGDPGVGTPNTALVMMTALGNCGNLNSGSTIVINEITTAAAAWALAPFISSYSSIGASATNSAGIANAFLDSQLLVNTSLGTAATLPSNLTVEGGKLYGLADALASCVNTSGGTNCGPLFSAATPNGGTAPADTLTAALNIVRNPGQNPQGVFNLIGPNPPFPSTLSHYPNDWTITMAITGGGLASPTAIGIDTNSNVWVADYAGALSEFNPQGTALSPSTGYGVGVLNEAYGLTIDTSNNIWVTNEESSPNGHGSVSKFLGSNSGTPGAVVTGTGGGTNFYDSSIDYPESISADTNGNVFIANYANSSVTVYNPSGQLQASGLANGSAQFPTAIAADSNHGFWVANVSGNTVTHVNSSHTVDYNPTCCYGANGLAVDSAGNVWIGNYYGNSFSEVSSTGSVTINEQPLVGTGNSSYPAGVSVDAGQNVWVANYRGESISNISGINSTTPGTLLSPALGFGYAGPPPAVPLLLLPYAVVPDRAGNLWVSNFGNGNLILFFGLATPTITPVQPVPTAP